MNFAPIVLFTYNRPQHTEQTLNALMLNEYADKSDLYIYCDAIKSNASKSIQKILNQFRAIVRKNK